MDRRLPAAIAVALLSALAGCPEGSGGPAAAGDTAAPDALADAEGAGEGPDAAGDAEASPPEEDGADGAPGDGGGDEADGDGPPAPFAHCPAGAAPADPTATLACPGGPLAVALHEGAVRLRPGPPRERPSWAVPAPPPPAALAFRADTPDAIALCAEGIAVAIARDTCRARVTDAEGRVLAEDAEAPAADRLVRLAPPGERYYGFGERTGALDRRGRRLVFWSTDAYDAAWGGYAPGQDPLYLSVPFFATLRDGVAAGHLLDDTHRLEVDVAAAAPDRLEVTSAGGVLEQWVLAGPTLADVLRRYTALTGRPPLPPRWALGFQQCRWGYTPAQAVLDVAAGLRARALPADGLWLDIQHLDGFRTFTWDPVAFPDPPGLVATLAADGFATTVIADPGIKVDPGWPVYDDGGPWIEGLDGEPFVGTVWPGASVFPDVSHPDARAWWGARVGELAALGVRGIWLDVNEPTTFPESGGGQTLPDALPVHGDGVPTTMGELHNAYALLQAEATRAGLLAAAPDRRPFVLSRAGFAGIQRAAFVWTGDAPSTWHHLRDTLPMLLGLGLSGVPFAGSDVGGYSGGATPELYARWMALGSISPFFRAHVTSGVPGQEPWAFGVEVEDVSRAHMTRRYRFMPYLYSLAAEAAATGAPLLRPMVWHFQGDPAFEATDTQAMLGPSLLVAPVLDEGAGEVTVALPAGRWYELRSGAFVDGPATVTRAVRLAALPVWVREGAVLPWAEPGATTADAAPGELGLDLYPGAVARPFTLYEDAGEGPAHLDGAWSRVTFAATRTDAGAVLTASERTGTWAPPARTLRVRARRLDHGCEGASLSGTPLPAHATPEALDAAGYGWWYDTRDLSAVALVPDAPPFELAFACDPGLDDPAPPVAVPLRVHVPPGTPPDPPVHVATAPGGWAHVPLGWEGGVAVGEIEVPRGEWFDYKYTRGDWCTVEKWPGCEEATNRYHHGEAWPVKEDTVYAWRDACDPCP